jgi:hypothetical protein
LRPGFLLILLISVALIISSFIKRAIVSRAKRPAEASRLIKGRIFPKGTFSLKAVAEANTWIKTEADGKVVFKNILSKGSEQTWEAQKRIKMRIGKPEGLKLYLNGKDLGEIKKVRIVVTPEGIQ